MKYKKSIIIIMLAIFLFAVAAVSAGDASQIEMSANDEMTDFNLQTSGENPALTVGDDDESLSAGTDSQILSLEEATYADLKTEIGHGGNISLTKTNYRYTGGDTIKIENSGVINGKGAVIDMAGSNTLAFNVGVSGVTIKNLTVKNAKCDGDGGAIYFSGSGTVENCNFTDNSAHYGAAVYFEGNGTVTNCNFIKNSATSGGAIDVEGVGKVTNCYFADNSVTRNGGVVWMTSGSVGDCNFVDNKATDNDGGAVYFKGNGNVTDCNFTNNSARYGGAVYVDGDSQVINCNFIKNSATSGGAIDVEGVGTVMDCYFADNSATNNGGAVWIYSGTVTNCNFADNSANQGGAIYSKKGNSAADACIFKSSSDTNFNTVIRPPTLNVDNFTTVYGSAERLTFDLKTNSGLQVTNGNISISVYFKVNNSWVGNYSCLSGEGWTVDLPLESYYAIFDTEYAEFKPIERTLAVTDGTSFCDLNRTINSNTNNIITLDRNYDYNSAIDSAFKDGIVIDRPVTIDGDGYTINANGKARIFQITSNDVVLKEINFMNGNTAGFGGAVYFGGDGDVTNCSFVNSSATSGGAIDVEGVGKVTNCYFADNSVTRNGGAVWMTSGSVGDCNFVDNKATDNDGGAVYFKGNGNVTDCNFTNNSARYGGAVYVDGDSQVINCNFTGNSAEDEGGAIKGGNFKSINCTFINNAAFRGAALSGGEVCDCSFINNSAGQDGGAVYKCKAYDCTFIGNTAKYGGAFYENEAYNCSFINNSAGQDGGAVWMSQGNFENCNFTDNIADGEGGAVYFYGSGGVTNCNFVNNVAYSYMFGGGAVYFHMKTKGTVINCSFTNSSATDGGAIILRGEGTVINCNFTNNKASRDGGAIWINGIVTNCSFTSNTANRGGAIHFSSDFTPELRNCNFYDNKVSDDGGAVNFNSNEGNAINCNFADNSANRGGAIYFWGNCNVTNCNFVNCVSNSHYSGGGALHADTGTVTNCSFTDNSANFGGAVFFWIYGTVTNCSFTNNSATDGGAIYGGTAVFCIFKTTSDTLYNADILPVFSVSRYVLRYDSGDKLLFNLTGDNKNYDGYNTTITLSKNGTVIGIYHALSGSDGGWVVNLGPGIYAATLSLESYITKPVTVKITDGTSFSFADLNEAINNNNANEITLDKNFTYDPNVDSDYKDGIIINRNLTINGHGMTLDGANSARIFKVTNGTVIFRNITFANGKTDGGGAAIYLNGDNLTVINCNFTGNSAEDEGGAIKGGNFKSINCTFINNAAFRGAALSGGEVCDCSFINNSAGQDGGAVYKCKAYDCTFIGNTAKYGGAFYENEAYNCSFINNSASQDGGAVWMSQGNFENCNFTNNSADWGGAIYFINIGHLLDCNFIGNNASFGGAVAMGGGSVTNCNFVDNSATDEGGAVWVYYCNFENCNFTGNDAAVGSAIYFSSEFTPRVVSNASFLNNMVNADFNLNVTTNNIEITLMDHNNFINAIYSETDVEFNNVAYWDAKGILNTDNSTSVKSNMAAGQSITVVGMVNGNIINTTKITDDEGKIVLEDVSGEYFIVVRPDGESYYTEAETISTNMKFNVDVTSKTTNNRAVNITAESNIYKEFMPGELLFIINSTLIAANYSGNGVWWALHTFDDYANYKVNATHSRLDNITINDANITVNKADSTLTVGDIVFDYKGSGFTAVSFDGAVGVNASVVGQPNAKVNVDGNKITVSGLNIGTYTLIVTTVPDADHNNVTKTCTIYVNKIKTEFSANDATITYNTNKDLVITLKDSHGNPFSGVKVSVDLNGPKEYTTDGSGQIIVSTEGLAPKTYTVKIAFNGDNVYEMSSKEVKITVNKLTPKIIAKAKTFKATAKIKKYTITLKDNTGKAIKKAKVTLKVKGKTYKAKTNSKGKATFKITKLNRKGTYKAILTFKANQYCNKATKKVKIKVKI